MSRRVSSLAVAACTTVGVTIDRLGALLVADDGGNVVWRVSTSQPVVRRD